MNKTAPVFLIILTILLPTACGASTTGAGTRASATPPPPLSTASLLTAPPPTAPAASVEPTLPPAPVETVTAGCQASPGSKVFESPEGDYCFTYPERFEVRPTEFKGMQLIGPPLDSSGDPLRARLTISVAELAAGGSLEQIIENEIADRAVPALPQPVRDTVQLSGEPAFKVGVLPGLPGSEEVFALHNNQVFRLVFEPPARDWPVAANEVTELYNAVMMSFRFLK